MMNHIDDILVNIQRKIVPSDEPLEVAEKSNNEGGKCHAM